jgi:hypothetical protein
MWPLSRKDAVRDTQVERLTDAFFECSTAGEGPGDQGRADAVYEAAYRNSTPAERQASSDRRRSY